MRLVRAAKVGYIFASIITMLVGLVLIIWPELSVSMICMVMGAIIMLSGAAKLFGYFTNDLYRLAFQFDLALGILTMLLGALMIFMPSKFSQFLFIAAAIYVIVNGLFTLQTAIEAKRFGLRKWWVLLAGAILSGLIGVLLLIKPFESAAAITRLVGGALIADGLQNLVVAALTIRIRTENRQDTE